MKRKNIKGKLLFFLLSGAASGVISKDAKKFDCTGTVLSKNIHELIEDGLIKADFVKHIYPRFGFKRRAVVSDESIIDFIMHGKPTGVLSKDAETLGFGDVSNYVWRLHRLIEAKKLELEMIEKIYDRFELAQKDYTSDQELIDFIRGPIAKKTMTEDMERFGYQCQSGYKRRLVQIAVDGLLEQWELERAYPDADWSMIEEQRAAICPHPYSLDVA